MVSKDDLQGLLQALGSYHRVPKLSFPSTPADTSLAPTQDLDSAPDVESDPTRFSELSSPFVLNRLLDQLGPISATPELCAVQSFTIVAICSAKGGVGRTTFTSHLAVAMQQRGHEVLVIDLDPQNALQHAFAITAEEGAEHYRVTGAEPGRCYPLWRSQSGVKVVPFGRLDEAALLDLYAAFSQKTSLLAQQLEDQNLPSSLIILVDTATGPSASLQQALGVADLALVVSIPEYACCFSLPLIDQCISAYTRDNSKFQGVYYALNKVREKTQAQCRVTQLLENLLNNELLGKVHYCAEFQDAQQQGLTLSQVAPEARATQELEACAKALLEVLQKNAEVRL